MPNSSFDHWTRVTIPPNRPLPKYSQWSVDAATHTVICAGNALAFLRLELAEESAVELREMPDYPALERGTGWRLYYYLAIDLLETWRLILREHRAARAMAADYEFIFSDGRYGFHSPWTPSFILSHQIAFVAALPLAVALVGDHRLTVGVVADQRAQLVPVGDRDTVERGDLVTGQQAGLRRRRRRRRRARRPCRATSAGR